MENERYLQLQLIISRFPYLHQFIDNDFIRQQCESGLRCHILKRLDNKESSYSMLQHLPTLEKRLAELTSITGYGRLCSRLRVASDWDGYQEFLAQIDITLWFKDKGILKEIEPELANSMGKADILLTFSQQAIYCEVTSFQSIAKSIESKTKREEKKIRELRKSQPWKTEQDVEHELKTKRVVRNLLDKTKRQLPSNHPGILALETGKSAIFGFDVRDIAQKLFPSRPQVVLIVLWSWESDGGDNSDLRWERNTPSCCFINGGSKFRQIEEGLLESLGLKGDVVSV